LHVPAVHFHCLQKTTLDHQFPMPMCGSVLLILQQWMSTDQFSLVCSDSTPCVQVRVDQFYSTQRSRYILHGQESQHVYLHMRLISLEVFLPLSEDEIGMFASFQFP